MAKEVFDQTIAPGSLLKSIVQLNHAYTSFKKRLLCRTMNEGAG